MKKEKEELIKKEDVGSKCFTYNVDMIVQIIAENEQDANERLNKDGGYVTRRDVHLIDAVALCNEVIKEKK